MKDIARDLGVSIVTVSKVLRNHSDIGVETRKRVLDRVKELNYTPNLSARGLVTGRTYLVGLIVPDLMNPFFAVLAKSLSEALWKKGYCLTISTSEDNAKLEEREIDRFLARRLDALVVASSCTDPAMFKRFLGQGPPLLLVDRRFDGLDANFVGVDDEAVGLLATRHLIESGCKRIAHLRGPEISPAVGRLKGYLSALAEYKLRPLPGYVCSNGTADVRSIETGEDLMRKLIAMSPRPDGVFCYNDPMAIGAIHAILESGLRIPEDIAVIGSGNLHYDSELRVPLSSIDQQIELIGERVGRMTLSILESKSRPQNKIVIIQPQLVIRASTNKRNLALENERKQLKIG